ncbi:MAG: threonine synthase [Anaerolineae bacterium]|nr:threonine synthase [Candidatus Roseilinea sp.]MDW8451312.1 threonine synthase [Anaerolineae bacterium]
MRSYLSHLECSYCGATYSADEIHTTCPKCGKVLLARYDLHAARQRLTPEIVRRRPMNMWRWFEIMPVRDPVNVVTLGEGCTPLLPAGRLGEQLGTEQLWIKDEGLNPTGSFKARGLSAAVSKAKELGVKAMAIPSAGNAASALAAYGARAGITVYQFMPQDVPEMMRKESHQYGARAYLVKGLINDAGRLVREGAKRKGWFDVSTLREPYRQEGKKTMGLELAEHFDWTLPDAIIYPTGGGTGIVGMWKAFDELEQLGWIGPKRPKMIVVQAEGCAPIVRAFEAGQRHAELFSDAHTIAPGIRVPVAIGDYLILDAVRQSGGTAITVSDEEIIRDMREMARLAGVFASPEGAATLSAYKKLRAIGFLSPSDKTVLFSCGSAFKNAELITPEPLPMLDPNHPDALERV